MQNPVAPKLSSSRRIDGSRSGFLGRFLVGHEADIQGPAGFADEFVPTVLMNADSRAEGTLFYAIVRKDTSGGLGSSFTPPAMLTAAHVFKYDRSSAGDKEAFFGTDVNYKFKMSLLGIAKVGRYFKGKDVAAGVKSSVSFSIFHNVRDFIFGSFKVVDTVIRWPVIASAALELFFERAGWAMRNNDIPYLRWPIRALGMVSSVMGVAASAVTSIAKVLVEFVRAPFAVAGGVVGLAFGATTALLSRGNENFRSVWQCMLGGVLDGIRPFAPAVADYLNFYADGMHESGSPPIPWGTIIGVTIGVALVVALSIVSFGGVAGVAAVLPFVLTKLGIGGIASSAYLAPLAAFMGKAVAAMQLSGLAASLGTTIAGIGVIGACTKAGTLIGNGLNALLNDTKIAFKRVVTAWEEHLNVRSEAMALASRSVNIPMVDLGAVNRNSAGSRNSNDQGAGIGLQPAHQPPVVANMERGDPTILQQQFRAGMSNLSDASKDLSRKLTPVTAAEVTRSNPFQHLGGVKHSASMQNLSRNNNREGNPGPITQNAQITRSQTYSDLTPAQKKMEKELELKTFGRRGTSASDKSGDSPPHSPGRPGRNN